MSRAGKNPVRFRERLEKRGLTIVNEIKCTKESFSIYEVQPKTATVTAALTQVIASQDEDLEAAEIKFGSKINACNPSINDPEFPSQTHLQALNFSEMRCLLDAMGITQQVQARVTVVDTGITPITNEMTDIVQFHFVGGANGTAEPAADIGSHGTAVTSVLGARTNNNNLFAGLASHSNPAVKLTSLRVADNTGAIDTFDAIRALTWCIDHQAERGGPGVINLSINSTALPTYNGSTIVQGIAKSLKKNDDLIVNGAGNLGIEDPSKEKYIRRVAGVDETDQLWSSSNFGPFRAAAPAVNVRVWNTATSAPAVASGTSLSTPCWSGAVALLISLNPNLTAPKADKLLFKEGRETAQGYIIPDLRTAIIKALKLRP
ncbi:MAG: S8 family serine peptidase [Candidatus Obscuribacterales bacterium]|nr:S8 family serine peptidase [Candidatus Obscuribacterales bacterium]